MDGEPPAKASKKGNAGAARTAHHARAPQPSPATAGPRSRAQQRRDLWAAGAGLVAVGTAVVLGELAAGLVSPTVSPVTAVGRGRDRCRPARRQGVGHFACSGRRTRSHCSVACRWSSPRSRPCAGVARSAAPFRRGGPHRCVRRGGPRGRGRPGGRDSQRHPGTRARSPGGDRTAPVAHPKTAGVAGRRGRAPGAAAPDRKSRQ